MQTFKSGDRVQWAERNGSVICTGSIINEEKYPDGNNPHGFWNIKVDEDHWRLACHTAYEMHMGWVNRSVAFNQLRLLGEA